LDRKRTEIRVGIAVLLSLVILIGGIMWGKGFSLRAKRYVIEVLFDNVGGLENGANVLANGVTKGRVKEILLEEGRVRVIASIDKNVTIYSDYHITVESPTVMAGKALVINPGQKLPPADITQPLTGDSPLGMTEAVATFRDISADLRTVLRNVDTLIMNLNVVAGDTVTRHNLVNIAEDLSDLAQQSSQWMTTNRERLTGTLTELEGTLASARQLMDTTQTRLAGTLTSADTAAQRVTELSGELNDIIARLNRGEGTMGRLLSDDELYNRLNRTLAEVDSLARSIRKNGMKQRIVLF